MNMHKYMRKQFIIADATLQFKIGKESGNQDQIQIALDKVEEILQLSEGSDVKGVHAIHGQILAELGELNGSLLAFKKALEADPRDSEVLYHAAMVLRRLGDEESARGSILAAISVDHCKPLFWITLSNIYFFDGNGPAAFLCAEVTDQLHPGLPVVQQARAAMEMEKNCQIGLSKQAALKDRATEIIECLNQIASVQELAAMIEIGLP